MRCLALTRPADTLSHPMGEGRRGGQISGQLVLPNAAAFLHCPAYFQSMHLNTLLAQAAAPVTGTATGTPGQAPQQPAWIGFAPMILLVVVFYFILIRPQQKRAKALAALVSSIKSGRQGRHRRRHHRHGHHGEGQNRLAPVRRREDGSHQGVRHGNPRRQPPRPKPNSS